MPVLARAFVGGKMFFRPFIARSLSSASSMAREIAGEVPQTMSAWQIKDYSGLNSLELVDVNVPPITQPNEVLVEVKSASVNAIDLMMTGN